MHSLIIFASGRGSNARAIIEYFNQNKKAKVALIVSNKADAGVLDIAKEYGIPTEIADKTRLASEDFLQVLKSFEPSYIVLAGFLWKIPHIMTDAFADRIINIHPALLPSYGGKGMYGHNVHNAVLAAQEKESGITIHYVNEVYDSGDIIVQARCKVIPGDTADTLAERIHGLEHYFFPRTIEYLLTQL